MIQHPVQLERAAWVSSFDIYPLEAMETKKALVARAIERRSNSSSPSTLRSPVSAT